jgi:hypothetical protein
MPCPKHKKLPDITVCSHCLGDMGEFIALAEQTLSKMPQVYGELFSEGMNYFQALAHIAQDPNIRCLCASGCDDYGNSIHDDQCAIKVAREAIQGHESRILHRPTDSQLSQLKADAAKWNESAQKQPVQPPAEGPKLVT